MTETPTAAVPLALWTDTMPTSLDDLKAQITYMQTVDGVIVFRRLPYGVVTEKLSGEPIVPSPFAAVPAAPQLKVWLDVPKLPWKHYAEIVAFFRAVWEKHKAEAIIRVFYDHGKREWVLNCPEQWVTGGHVDHNEAFDAQGELHHVLDIHSHNTMSPFFSGTDDTDEKKAVRLYGVVGHITHAIPGASWRAWTGKVFADLTIKDIVELPDGNVDISVGIPLKKWAADKEGVKNITVDAELVSEALFPPEFPKEWMEKVNNGHRPTQGASSHFRPGSRTGAMMYSGGNKFEWDHDRREWVDVITGEPRDFSSHSRGSGYTGGFLGGGPYPKGKNHSDSERKGRRGNDVAGSGTERQIPFTAIGPAEAMVPLALEAGQDIDTLVYIANTTEDVVYRVYPDGAILPRVLKCRDLIQLEDRKKQVSHTTMKIFGVLRLTEEDITRYQDEWRAARVSKGGNHGRGR